MSWDYQTSWPSAARLALVAGLLALSTTTGCGGPRFTPMPCPPITAEGWLNGEPPPRDDWAGRVVVLHAWASW